MLEREKIAQARELMKREEIDVWLIYCRETSEIPEPALTVVAGTPVVWESALIIGVNGESIAIVGGPDAPAFRAKGVFETVVPYDEDIGPALRQALSRLNPRRIAIDYSEDDVVADGLTHGMYRLLLKRLAGAPYGDRLTSAAPIVTALRAIKTPEELRLIRRAIASAEEILAQLTKTLRVGLTESEIHQWVSERVRRRNLAPAWDAAHCPTVTCGANSPIGHTGPTDAKALPGDIIRLDFGVKENDYCSDLQRVWYLRRPGEVKAPAEVRRAFDTCRKAIEAGFAALKPGVVGWQVDAAARKVITDAGYSEFKHALGHSLGRNAHDGGPLLGPRWARYGRTPLARVEAGNVFTLELGVMTPAGYVGLEEDVVVTASGAEYLSKPQTEIVYV